MTINVRVRDGMCPDPTTGDGGATEGDIRGSFSDIIDVVGVKDLAGGHCAVTENSPAALSVLVAPGIVYIPNADYDELDSNQVRFWEAIVTVSTAVTITANTSGSTRIDLICAKMDTAVTPDEHASNIVTLVAVAGTPGAGTPATPDNHYVLATVAVANGASTIVNADITDSRVQAKINSDYIGASVSVTTKGDLQTYSTVPIRLPVGTDGQILESRASETTGLKWVTPSSSGSYNLFQQAIINGNFDVWQRGTSIAMTAANAYSADRWYCETATAGTDKTISREDGTGVNGSYYCARVKMVSDVDELLTFSQALESQDSIKFRGQKVTLSFYARGGAEFVADNATLVSKIVTGKGTDQKVLAFTTSADGVSQNNTLTTSWQKFTCTTTAAIASDITQIGVSFAFTHAGSGTTTNYFEITQVQLCAGDVALPFMPKSFEEELRACQRYYEKSFDYTIAPAEGLGTGAGGALHFIPQSTFLYHLVGTIYYKVTKRITAPTITYYNPAGANAAKLRNITDSTNHAIGSAVSGQNSFYCFVNNSSIAANKDCETQWTSECEL